MSDYLITGASSGIGFGLARELAQRGHRVWGIARKVENLSQLACELGPAKVFFSVCDVGQKSQVKRTISVMEEAGFSPDVVILNAGINPEHRDDPFRLDEFETIMQVNLYGALIWIEAFLPIFREKRAGHFVAISSLAAYRGDGRWVAYSASKAALSRTFESFRGRHRGEGIVFTTIHLGTVESGMGRGVRNPLRLSRKRAVERILDAIDRHVSSINIPRISRILLSLTWIVPDHLFSRLVGKILAKHPTRAVENGCTLLSRDQD